MVSELLLRLTEPGMGREIGRSVGSQASSGVGDSLGKGFEMIAVIATLFLVALGLLLVFVVVRLVRKPRPTTASDDPPPS